MKIILFYIRITHTHKLTYLSNNTLILYISEIINLLSIKEGLYGRCMLHKFEF